MICKNCESHVPNGNRFCPQCGGSVAQPPAQQVVAQTVMAPAYQVVTPVAVAMQPKSNGLCVAGFVLGILAVALFWIPFFGIILGVVGVSLSAVGMAVVKTSEIMQGGFGMAVAGLVLSCLNVLFWIIYLFAVFVS